MPKLWVADGPSLRCLNVLLRVAVRRQQGTEHDHDEQAHYQNQAKDPGRPGEQLAHKLGHTRVAEVAGGAGGGNR